MSPHVVLSGEELAAVWTLDLLALHGMHVLVMFVEVGLVVGAIVTQLTLELLWLIREVGMVVDLRKQTVGMNESQNSSCPSPSSGLSPRQEGKTETKEWGYKRESFLLC